MSVSLSGTTHLSSKLEALADLTTTNVGVKRLLLSPIGHVLDTKKFFGKELSPTEASAHRLIKDAKRGLDVLELPSAVKEVYHGFKHFDSEKPVKSLRKLFINTTSCADPIASGIQLLHDRGIVVFSSTTLQVVGGVNSGALAIGCGHSVFQKTFSIAKQAQILWSDRAILSHKEKTEAACSIAKKVQSVLRNSALTMLGIAGLGALLFAVMLPPLFIWLMTTCTVVLGVTSLLSNRLLPGKS